CEIETGGLGKGPHLAVEQALEVCKGGVALRQVVETRIAGVAPIPVSAAPAAARAIFFGEQPAALLEFLEQIGRANVGFVEICGEERANGHDGRESTADARGQGRRGWNSN